MKDLLAKVMGESTRLGKFFNSTPEKMVQLREKMASKNVTVELAVQDSRATIRLFSMISAENCFFGFKRSVSGLFRLDYIDTQSLLKPLWMVLLIGFWSVLLWKGLKNLLGTSQSLLSGPILRSPNCR